MRCWQDWKAVPLLTEVYEDCRNNDLRTVRAIIGFLFVCLKSEQDGDTHVAAANRLLDRIRSENGRVVRSVERDFR